MAWTKASQSLVDLFDESLPDDPRLERRKMFGYPCAFVAGNMAAGLFGDRIFARLSPEDRAALPGGGEDFAPMPGRAMKGYVLVPDDVVADEGALAETLARAVSFTGSLPPKEKKVAKARTKAG